MSNYHGCKEEVINFLIDIILILFDRCYLQNYKAITFRKITNDTTDKLNADQLMC